MELTFVYILVSGFLLDLLVGDPKLLPHLIVGYGNLISSGEKQLNKGASQFIKGMLLTIVLVGSVFLLPFFFINFLRNNNYHMVEIAFSILMLFYCLANKTLVIEGKAVFNVLNNEGLEAGRKRLSWIVGRDTSALNEQQIRIATLETMSENLSDGIIAPLFYFVCFGVPGIMAYKMINTLDSMIGYKNDRYEQFGKFAAILDDVVNYIPSRITAILILVVQFKIKGVFFVFKEGKKHSSPNAGYPEAALAYVINCQFGGPNFYGGKIYKKPFIGTNNRLIQHQEINKVANINYASSIVFVIVSVLVFLWLK
ncbi:adenosylcobinamide-phosphate synthase [Lutibacter agarilyticus]|uniref:Cobalamin biosynthesis protein CobD n=1 Tax=Lutibacter agarilyticus TaxID=1109740 RepID=A0A238WYZ7_9FLAO|nr:adenosylcobinamide-phosphate synthase CbiB [Lutibacter agarilyticus]SNR51682.1 adenosylcobinamide-phosphate synthase [Lutibacter agarilyticus]